MVHKPGMADHDFDHLPGGPVPDRAAAARSSPLHERWPGSSRRRRSSRSRSTPRSSRDDDEARRIIAATAAETGLPCDDPVRFGGEALWREIEAGVDALPWVGARGAGATRRRAGRDDLLDPAADARPAAARPVRDRAGRRTARDGRRRRSSPSCGTTPTGPTGRSASARAFPDPFYGETPETIGVVVPLLLEAIDPIAAGPPGRPRRGAGRARGRGGPDGRGDRPPRRGQVRDRHRAPRPRRQAAGPAGPRRCWASTARSRPPTSRSASTSRPSSPSARAGPRTSRRSRSRWAVRPTSRRPRRCAPSSRGPIRVDANTGWTPEEARGAAPRARSGWAWS